MILALRLAKGGWWGGDPDAVLGAPADRVMLAVQYEGFTANYETEMYNIAKREAQ